MKYSTSTNTIVVFTALISMLYGCSDPATIQKQPTLSQSAEDATNWPTYGGQPSGTQYSSLKQINIHTIDELKVAWTYHAGEISKKTEESGATVYEVTPIYANEHLYICTPYNNVVALDPKTGTEVWRYDPKIDKTHSYYGVHRCRGVSYWQSEDPSERKQFCGKRVFEGLSNGSLIVLDATTGKLCPDFADNGRLDLNQMDYKGEGDILFTSPTAIYADVVIIGGSIYDNKWQDTADGIVRGIDARTGDIRWSWNPIPDELSDQTGGANVWAPMSVDQERGWVFLPTGSPSYDVLGTNRTKPIPDGNAVVVLDALTGEKVWSYQVVRHDLWDYDLPAMPTLVEVQRKGTSVQAVLQATKMGFLFLLDRESGEPLFPVEEVDAPLSHVPGEYTSPTQKIPTIPLPVAAQEIKPEDAWGALLFDQAACRRQLEPLRNEGLYTPPSEQGSVLFPSFTGGTNWGGIAYDQASGIAVVNSSNLVASAKLLPRSEFDEELHSPLFGSPYVLERDFLFSPLGAPCNPPPWGQLTAVDMNSGKTIWQIPFGRVPLLGGLLSSPSRWGGPNTGGPMITAGGLIFIGASLDHKFRAYDLYTGKQVWSGQIPAPATATPMTFEHGPDKTQYVVVAAGGHAGYKTKLSDAIVAFKLGD